MPNDPSPPTIGPGPTFHTRCPADPQLPIPVVDLGAFQALVRAADGALHSAGHADQVRSDAAALEQLARQLLPYTEPISGDTGGHTPLDVHSLRRAGVDVLDRQVRERAVPCRVCQDPTWNLAACCDLHYRSPGDVALQAVPA